MNKLWKMSKLQVLLLFMVCSDAVAISLRDLYNSDVTYAEYYTRAKKDGGKRVSGIVKTVTKLIDTWWRVCRLTHSGVVVTIGDGSKWLIHKGKTFGSTWDTVITDAKMSSAWTREKCGHVSGKTVNDFMQAAKIDCVYSLLFCNCRHAADGMWGLVNETSC